MTSLTTRYGPSLTLYFRVAKAVSAASNNNNNMMMMMMKLVNWPLMGYLSMWYVKKVSDEIYKLLNEMKLRGFLLCIHADRRITVL